MAEHVTKVTGTPHGVRVTNDMHHVDYVLTWAEINLANDFDLWPTAAWESVKPRIDELLERADFIRRQRAAMSNADKGR